MAFTYNPVTEIGDKKLTELLYDDKINIYEYQQYSDHPGIKQLFKYFDKTIKDYRKLIYIWLIYKSNQYIPEEPYLPQEYYTYLVKWFYGLPEVFGTPRNKYQWDQTAPVVNWDDPKVKWDEVSSSGVLDVNKVKALMRFIQNITQVQFTIENFLDFCKDFCYLAKDVDIFIDDTSFVNPTEINVYYTKTSEEIIELQKILNTFKNILPMYTFKLVLKQLP